MAELDGKLCIITGGTAGIGLATAERLAAMGASLLLVGRDQAKGERAQARLGSVAPQARVKILYADLTRPAALGALATQLLEAAPRIDVLINNAGAIFRRRGETEDGLERSFALNHMGYFRLTQLLQARLVASAPARIVNVASTAHRGARLDFDDLQTRRSYDGWTAYRRSKLCNILFTRALARRLAGTGVTANCLHPGFVASEFGDNNDGVFRMVLTLGKRLVAISPARGAETPVHLASSPEVAPVSGLYFDKCRAVPPSAAAQDDAAGERLWQDSVRLAGLPARE
jgi:NAD(P)-dependent dehydrogenase (short-subunit alcohol dehydrogenase family)